MDVIFNSKLICLKSGSTMNQAKELMKERRVRHLPIVDDQNRITGIVSKTDMTDVLKFGDLSADLFASFPVISVTDDALLWRVALLMIEKKISSVILVDDNRYAVGIITSDDLLFQLAQILQEKQNKSYANWNRLDLLTTAGEFFRRMADIGI